MLETLLVHRKVIGLFLCASLIACSENPQTSAANLADTDNARQPFYAIAGDSYNMREKSLLLPMDMRGELSVCIMATSSALITTDDINNLKSATVQAINGWNNLLNQPPPPSIDDKIFPSWRRASITVNFVEDCDSPVDFKVVVNGSQPNSAASTMFMVIEFAKYQLYMANDVIMHELGHLLGIDDTYSLAGYQTPEGQPHGMMNPDVDYKFIFSDDDAAAIWNLWRYVKNGGDPCGPGYVKGLATENATGSNFCVKEEKPATSSQD